jgi:hypothetical protein
VDPDPNPAGSEIICNLGYGYESVIYLGSGSESRSTLSSVSNNKYKLVKMYRLKKKISFFEMFR